MPPAKPVFANRFIIWGMSLLVLGGGLSGLVWMSSTLAPAPAPTMTITALPPSVTAPPTPTAQPSSTSRPTLPRPSSTPWPTTSASPTPIATLTHTVTPHPVLPTATATKRRIPWTATATPSPQPRWPPPTEPPPLPPTVEPTPTPLPTPPQAPSNLDLSFTSPVVVITWADNSGDELGFNLTYRVDDGPALAVIEPYAPANMTSAPLARLFMCESLETSHTVTAAINAFNAAGTSATIENALTFTVAACPASTPTATPAPTALPMALPD